MTIKHYTNKLNLHELSELDKVKYIFFYLDTKNGTPDFTIKEISEVLTENGFSKPNSSRLKENLTKSKMFIKGKRNGSFCLSYKIKKMLEAELPELEEKSEEIFSSDVILPENLFMSTRGYIEKICKQINASYENNIFDGSAVLMRRLIELLLIEGYIYHNRLSEIQDNNDLKNLNTIINYTVSNNVFNLSKSTKECLDDFRKLGNFSAHRIQYNCTKSEIKKVAMEFRVAVEELLYASHLKK